VSPRISGESWLAVDVTARPVPSWTSHAQPLPKRAAPAALTCRLSSRIDPNVASIASPSGPAGRPW